MGRCGQDRIERAEPCFFLEQAQPFAQVSCLDDKKRRQQLYVVTGKFRSVFAVTTASADVSELLDDFDCGGRQDRSPCYCADQLLAWLAQRVIGADRIDQDRRVKDDQA